MSLTIISTWPGKIKLFAARESLASDILARGGKIVNLFYSVLPYKFLEIQLDLNGG
jgi:hypothetical protein